MLGGGEKDGSVITFPYIYHYNQLLTYSLLKHKYNLQMYLII